MSFSLIRLLLVAVISIFAVRAQLAENYAECKDWIAYSDIKCYKILSKKESYTHELAKHNCLKLDVTATLISINSKEEDIFLSNLFSKEKIVDNVWIGLQKENKTVFKWMDNEDSELKYTDWAKNNGLNDPANGCVEMNSPYNNLTTNTGKWTSVPCNKNNIVICQRMQATYQLRKVFDKKILELEAISKRMTYFMEETELKYISESIPSNFIYTQYPYTLSPQEIWPRLRWTDISEQYSDVFFRVIGRKSGSFGKVQEESQTKVTAIDTRFSVDGRIDGHPVTEHSDYSPLIDRWSNWVYTGSFVQVGKRYLRLNVESHEVRPVNMAIKIWRRYG